MFNNTSIYFVEGDKSQGMKNNEEVSITAALLTSTSFFCFKNNNSPRTINEKKYDGKGQERPPKRFKQIF